jgi:SNF2 family DNA or RNA helicase
MQYEPHEYQSFATEYIKNHPISALLVDMGLGKTVITLTALLDLLFDSFLIHKVLVVAPLRVGLISWPDELVKWDHLHFLKSSIVIGSEIERLRALKAKADIYIINRENLEWLVERSGNKFDFDVMVIDELSSFKNAKSKRHKALMMVRPYVKRIIGLTGTPAANGLMDLFAEFKCLDCGSRLGRFITRYRTEYFLPDKTNGMVVFSYKPQVGAEERIYKKISDITISMKAIDHLKMPSLVDVEHAVELSDSEKAFYEELQDEMIAEIKDKEITSANAAVLTGKLLQVANGAIYSDGGEVVGVHERKLDALEDIIEGANGKPLLVAYWFKHDLERIKKRLDKLGTKYGILDQPEMIRKWNARELEVGLVHPASAGHGLNLQTGGNTIVWYGLTWSLELYQQTIARIYRQGQKEKTVVVIHIVSKGTMDETVLKALKRKNATQSRLIDAVKAKLKGGSYDE